jgi:HSP20 family protein
VRHGKENKKSPLSNLHPLAGFRCLSGSFLRRKKRNCFTPPEPLTEQVRDHQPTTIRNKIRCYIKPGEFEKKPVKLESKDNLESSKEDLYMKLPIKRPSRDVYSWDPFDEIRKMQEYMEQMSRAFPALETGYESGTLSPLTDVVEEDNRVIVTTDLPGIDRENVELSMRDNFLVISAAKGEEEETEKEGYLRKERSFMRYYREIPLPEGVTEEGATAQLKNGVLTVAMPKTKSVTGRKILIE